MNRGRDGESVNDNPDRNDERDKSDGRDDTLETKSVSGPSDTSSPEQEKKRDLRNRPDTYNAMGIQEDPVEHPSDDAKVPGRILDRKDLEQGA